MRSAQRGVTLVGLIIGLTVLVFLALLAMKLIPVYMEYYTARNAILAIARSQQGGSVNDVRRAWESRSAVDDITAVKGSDLEISKDGNQLVLGFAYRKEVPLFANLGVYIDFAASSRGD
jgi:Domain of unknown function (DUF4845)